MCSAAPNDGLKAGRRARRAGGPAAPVLVSIAGGMAMRFGLCLMLALGFADASAHAACRNAPFEGAEKAYLQVAKERMAAAHGVLMTLDDDKGVYAGAKIQMHSYYFGRDVFTDFSMSKGSSGIYADVTDAAQKKLLTLATLTIARFGEVPEDVAQSAIAKLLIQGKHANLTAAEIQHGLLKKPVAAGPIGKLQVEVMPPVLDMMWISIQRQICD
jgi:hypothetical protein